MIPLSLPELSKPSRTFKNIRKTEFFRKQNLKKSENVHDYLLLTVKTYNTSIKNYEQTHKLPKNTTKVSERHP